MTARAASSLGNACSSVTRGNALESDGGIRGCLTPQHRFEHQETAGHGHFVRNQFDEGGKRADDDTATAVENCQCSEADGRGDRIIRLTGPVLQHVAPLSLAEGACSASALFAPVSVLALVDERPDGRGARSFNRDSSGLC